jgi:hypothetical protein
MNKIIKIMSKAVFILAFTASVSHAATYSFSIVGTVDVGEEFFGLGSNSWGLSAGDTIIASGMFTTSLTGGVGNESGVVEFGQFDGNTLTIETSSGGDIASESGDDGYLTNPASLTFSDGALSHFDFLASSAGATGFNSSFTSFDNLGGGTLFGTWDTNVTLSEVPIPAAAWLFGSALLTLAGLSKKKRA